MNTKNTKKWVCVNCSGSGYNVMSDRTGFNLYRVPCSYCNRNGKIEDFYITEYVDKKEKKTPSKKDTPTP